jgi:mannose-6-phosphate isomerase class I
VWGGDRLRGLAPDAAPRGPIGEAWFGDADEQPGGVLVKLLDVQDRLSVQVHPDDALAKVMHGADAIGKHKVPGRRAQHSAMKPTPLKRHSPSSRRCEQARSTCSSI